MDARVVVGIADLLDAAGDAAHERHQLLALEPDVLADDLERSVRQQLHAFQDHAVELAEIVLVARREDRDRRGRDRAAVFARDHFGHRLLVAQRGRVQQRLAHAVADRGVQPLAAARIVVHLLGVRPELRYVAAAQGVGNFAAHVVDVVFRVESGVAPGDAREDHVGAIAERDLPVLQHEHHRNDRRRLDDFGEARRHRLAFVQAAVRLRLCRT